MSKKPPKQLFSISSLLQLVVEKEVEEDFHNIVAKRKHTAVNFAFPVCRPSPPLSTEWCSRPLPPSLSSFP